MRSYFNEKGEEKMNITLSIISNEDKPVLSNLMQLYRYDSSEFDGHKLGPHGLYSYKYLDHQWTDTYRRPFMICVDREIAGFVLLTLDMPKEFAILSVADRTNVISDFFIMRKFRYKGIGKYVAHSLFEQFQGNWEIKQTIGNKPAYIFWKKAISEYTHSKGLFFQEKIINNEKWNGPVFVFNSSSQ